MLFDDVMTRGKTTPMHSHPEVDETLYVLDGEILVHIDGREQKVGRGGMAMVPRGVPHAAPVDAGDTRLQRGFLSRRQRTVDAEPPGDCSGRFRSRTGVGGSERRHRDSRTAPFRQVSPFA